MKQQSEEPSGDAGWPINTNPNDQGSDEAAEANLDLMGPLLFALHDSASDRGPLYQKRTLNKNFIRFGKSEMKEKIMKRILEEVENGHRMKAVRPPRGLKSNFIRFGRASFFPRRLDEELEHSSSSSPNYRRLSRALSSNFIRFG